jgi:hypothetical protein
MKHYAKLFSLVSVGTLMGCAQPWLVPAPESALVGARMQMPATARVQPVERITGGVSAVESLVILGRSAQSAGQRDLAEERYAQALILQPQHLGAVNAMAVLYAQTDRVDQAIELFRRALALDPNAAHVHNNLGYALLLAGRLDESGAELKLARDLNPSNAQTGQNLELLARSQAQALAGPQLVAVGRNVYELRDRPATVTATAPIAVPTPFVAAVRMAPAAPPAATAQRTAVQLPAAAAQIAAPTVVAIQPVAATPVAVMMQPAAKTSVAIQQVAVAPAAVATQPAAAPAFAPRKEAFVLSSLPLQGVRLEVSNGVGIRHLARRTAERLSATGLVPARLTNQAKFQQAKTEIQFSAGQGQAAGALSAQFPVGVKTVASARLLKHIQLRLVLGHDMAGKALLAWLESAADTRVAAAAQDGWRWS